MSNEFITDIDELIGILGLSGRLRSDVNFSGYAEAVLKSEKLNTQAQQRGTIVQGRSLPSIPAPVYPLLVPREFVKLMEVGNPSDPLLLQVLPQAAENYDNAGFTQNPLDEKINSKLPILKKYCGRALLMLNRQCGIHCRFCFRRHILHADTPAQYLPSSTELKLGADVEETIDSVASDKSINEVILSGGDPLVQNDEQLKTVLDYIEKIPHVKRIRIHSRFLVVMPERITENLNIVFKRAKPIYLVLHVNHLNELSENFIARLKILDAPVILSQTVLLRGINDDADVLAKLFEKLADNRVIPYYLHQLDRVAGAAHFEVNTVEGCRIVANLRERLSGYAVPRYVQEIAGENCKKILH
ncbi:MAG: KamA family radical SAM protein [Planctomycetaceae bacterium]|jgi:EF-P beta-lysylation protein EpmB|nr:KamA family radical SAM protein [Planctomycetaceae bacterium]